MDIYKPKQSQWNEQMVMVALLYCGKGTCLHWVGFPHGDLSAGRPDLG